MKTKIFRNLFLLIVLFNSLSSFAGKTSVVKGKVTNPSNQPVEFATAVLLDAKTKKIEKGAVSNEKGEFLLDKVQPGEYLLAISMVGYNTNDQQRIVIDGDQSLSIVKNVVLTESSVKLAETVVVGKKKFIEQTADKMIINPEASVTTASENVYEIMKKLPGVAVDDKDNISLKGKSGVKVMIDDKPTYLSAEQLAAMLKGMQGKNIDKIEIIENPSSRYDAEGSSGIINLKTKHNRAPGFNGNVYSGLNVGRRLGENIGIDLNANLGKLNLYGNYSFNEWRGFNDMDGLRRFTTPALVGATQNIFSKENYNGHSHNYKVGADYYFAKNHVVSVMLNGNTGKNLGDGVTTTSFKNKLGLVDSSLVTDIARDTKWHNNTYNVNYKWDIDSAGRSLMVDADYAQFYFRSFNEQKSTNFDASGADTHRPLLSNSDQSGSIDIFTTKFDYSHPINKRFSIEAGAKFSFVSNDSRADMTGYLTQNDRFVYDENIQAGYASGRGMFGKTMVQLGFRVENTDATGTSHATGDINHWSYVNLFPSLFIQQTLPKEQSVSFNYSYRIGRPSYHDLNPFKWALDPYTFNIGNPLLQPQFTHSLGANYSWKNALITSVGLSFTDQMFTQYLDQDDATKAIYQTMANLGKGIDFNVSETVQLPVTKWWNLNGTVTGMYKKVESQLGGKGTFDRWTLMGNMTNSFTLPAKINLELSGNYRSKMLWGNFSIYESYNIDLGLQKKLFNDKGTLKIAVTDIFRTNNGGGFTKYDNVDIDVKGRYDSRQLNVSFSYRFGKDGFKTRANRSTASSEEQSRSNSK